MINVTFDNFIIPNEKVLPKGWDSFYSPDPKASYKLDKFFKKLDQLLQKHHSKISVIKILSNGQFLVRMYKDPKVYHLYYDGIRAYWSAQPH